MGVSGFARICAIGLAAASLVGIVVTARASDGDVAAFYAGKQVTIVIGSSPGGGYDLYGRLVGRYLGKYIPGNPKIVVTNMSGAASIVSLQYIANVAPKDGTVIGAIYPSAVMEPLIGDKAKAHYDAATINYIGSANRELYVCVARVDAGVTTWADLLAKPLFFGASAAGGSTHDFPVLLNTVFGAKLKLVSGYPGSTEITLAMEKNEVQGVCGVGWSSIAAERPDWINGSVAHVVAQEGMKSSPRLDKLGVPTVLSEAKTDEQRELLTMFYAPLDFGRPFVMAPGVPDDRVAAIRRAFDQTMHDPQLQDEAEKLHIDALETTGPEVEQLVRKLYQMPPGIVEKARAVTESGN